MVYITANHRTMTIHKDGSTIHHPVCAVVIADLRIATAHIKGTVIGHTNRRAHNCFVTRNGSARHIYGGFSDNVKGSSETTISSGNNTTGNHGRTVALCLPNTILFNVSGVFTCRSRVHDGQNSTFVYRNNRSRCASGENVSIQINGNLLVGYSHIGFAKNCFVIYQILVQDELHRTGLSGVAVVFVRFYVLGKLQSNLPHFREGAFRMELSVIINRRLRAIFDLAAVLCDGASFCHFLFDSLGRGQHLFGLNRGFRAVRLSGECRDCRHRNSTYKHCKNENNRKYSQCYVFFHTTSPSLWGTFASASL